MADGADHKTFEQAVQHHREGRLEAAERLYRQVLPSDTRHADALHLLGVAVLQLGRHEEALELIGQAVRARPEEAAYRLSLGQVHARSGAARRVGCGVPPGNRARSADGRCLVRPGSRPASRQSPAGGDRRLPATARDRSPTMWTPVTISPVRWSFAGKCKRRSPFIGAPWRWSRPARRRTTT